uniref:Uncharacterized protein n=1 Tax=Moniliophthora roreri TaxID=221103 RepID=A0A0W0G9D0_MONRR
MGTLMYLRKHRQLLDEAIARTDREDGLFVRTLTEGDDRVVLNGLITICHKQVPKRTPFQETKTSTPTPQPSLSPLNDISKVYEEPEKHPEDSLSSKATSPDPSTLPFSDESIIQDRPLHPIMEESSPTLSLQSQTPLNELHFSQRDQSPTLPLLCSVQTTIHHQPNQLLTIMPSEPLSRSVSMTLLQNLLDQQQPMTNISSSILQTDPPRLTITQLQNLN